MKEIKKTITKRLRLSDDDWRVIEAKMEETNLTFSGFALATMLNKKIVTKDQKNLLSELSKIGVNLNQISRYCNTKKQIDDIVLAMIKNIKSDISEIVKNVS